MTSGSKGRRQPRKKTGKNNAVGKTAHKIASEEKYRLLVQHVRASIAVVDRDGKFLFVNEVGANALGATVDRIVGKTMWDVFPKRLADRQIKSVRLAIDKEKLYNIESKTMVGDGWRWYDVVLQPFRDSPGKASACMVIAHDITDRKRNENLQLALYKIANATNTTKDLNELFESIRKELSLVVDTTNFCIALYDQKSDLITLPYNVDEKDKFDSFPAGKTLMSYVIKNDVRLLVTDKDIDDMAARGFVETIGAPAKVWVGVPLKIDQRVIGAIALQHYEDSHAYTEDDLNILKFVSGQIALAIERKRAEEALQTAHDQLEKRVEERTSELLAANRQLRKEIANRQRIEDALRESERRYSMATSAGQVGVWDWNLETNEIFVDPNLKDILGYEDKEIPNHLDHWQALIHPEDVESMMADIRSSLERPGGHFEIEHRMLHKSGDIRWMLARGTAVRGPDGKPSRMISTETDITDRKRAEAMLRKTAEELRAEREALYEKNVALKQILGHIEKERKDYQQRICQDVRQAIDPFLESLRTQAAPGHEKALEELEANLNVLLSKDIDVFEDRYATLSPREVEICELLKNGLSSKQISAELSLSLVTVHKHREKIRKKLGLTNKSINLSTFLRSH